MELARRSHTPKGQLARERILHAAERLLAQRGFHGTSMRDVAEGCSLPLATVVYHFAKKEKLYAAILDAIAAELLDALRKAIAHAGDHIERLDAIMMVFVDWATRRPDHVRIVVRELVDNEARVAKAKKLPLAPILESFAAVIASGVRAGAFSSEIPEVTVLHLIGAVSYLVIAQPTVRRILGREREKAMLEARAADAIRLARRALAVASPPARPKSKGAP